MKKSHRIKKQKQLDIGGLIRWLVVLIVVVGLATALVSLYKLFRVQTVECRLLGAEACPDDLVQTLQFIINQPLFFVDFSKQISTVQLPQPVRLSKISKKLPSTLRLSFQLEPVAYVISTDQDIFFVSQSGQLYQQQFEQTGLVQVRLLSAWSHQSGSVELFIHHSLLAIIAGCQQLKLPLQTITWLDNSTIQLSMENRSEIFVIDSQQPNLELHRLALVLQSGEYQALTQSKQELDLRFKMPVLRTAR